jgi:hypothetical protein
MIGIDAASNLAEVIQLQTIRHRADEQLIDNPMGRALAASDVGSAIARVAQSARP